jgi:hypothetical protein
MTLTLSLLLIGSFLIGLRSAQMGNRMGIVISAALLIMVGVTFRGTAQPPQQPSLKSDTTELLPIQAAPGIRVRRVQLDASLLPAEATCQESVPSRKLEPTGRDHGGVTNWPCVWIAKTSANELFETCTTPNETVVKAVFTGPVSEMHESAAITSEDREPEVQARPVESSCSAFENDSSGSDLSAASSESTRTASFESSEPAEATDTPETISASQPDSKRDSKQAATELVAENVDTKESGSSESATSQSSTGSQAESASTDGVAENLPAADASAAVETKEKAAVVILDREPQGSTTNVRYPDRETGVPAWLEREKAWTEADTVFVAVASGLRLNERECEEALQERIQSAISAYLTEQLGSRHVSTLLAPEITAWAQSTVTESFHERVLFSRGEMQQQHVLVAFDDSFRDAVKHRWASIRRVSRMLQAALGAAVVIGMLSITWGYTRVDTATRGYHTRVLQLAALIGALTVIAGAIYLARALPWL